MLALSIGFIVKLVEEFTNNRRWLISVFYPPQGVKKAL